MRVVFDIECDGLLDTCTKIHCLSYFNLDTNESVSLTDYEDIKKFLQTDDLELIGHNVIKFDIPVIKKILGIKPKARAIDTLGLSWVLNPKRKRHGLEEYGTEFGVEKPLITDWNSLSTSDYIFRCEEDVKINTLLWRQQWSYLLRLYDNNINSIINFCRYIELKLTCVAEQEILGVNLDEDHCRKMLEMLYKEKEEKITALTLAMPGDKKMGLKNIPAKIYKKDGSVSKDGEKWFEFLDAHGLPSDWIEPVEYIKEILPANPNSVDQKKNWLYSLGWIPEHIQYKRDKETGEIKEIPQIKHKNVEKEGEVCHSVNQLFEREPALELLEGLSIITHRIGIFEGFLRDARNGRLHPGMSGFTNTMRLKHTVIVNLPSIHKKYGKEVRGALIADENKILCGSDLSNIESQTRNHYIFPYDAPYVADMTAPGFDSHTDIAVLAGFITKEEEEFFKWFKSYDKEKQEHTYKVDNNKINLEERGTLGYTFPQLLTLVEDVQKSIIKKISEQRSKGKTVNFAAIYGSGALTLSRNSGLDFDLCVKLLEVYWQRNWAVRTVAENTFTKEIDGQMWLYNPISGFYYTLRNEKDRFSTLNQGSAVYVFDVWMSFLRKQGIIACLQMHDEVMFNLSPNREEEIRARVQKAMDNTNDVLKLNITVGCSADFGVRYSDIH